MRRVRPAQPFFLVMLVIGSDGHQRKCTYFYCSHDKREKASRYSTVTVMVVVALSVKN